jgi:hypothetical protein
MKKQKSTSHLKERNKSGEDLGNYRSPRDEATHAKQILYGPGHLYTKRRALRDVAEGRSSDKAKTSKRKKDQSRLSPTEREHSKIGKKS